MEVSYDGRCFGCGPLNPDGLRMRFEPVGEESVCEFRVPSEYQSWAGVVHGGIIALLLDEAVGWAAWHRGHPAVTGKLEVRYRQPLRLGEHVRVAARLERVRRTLIYAVGEIRRLSDGGVVAEATATLMDVPASVDVPGSAHGQPVQ